MKVQPISILTIVLASILIGFLWGVVAGESRGRATAFGECWTFSRVVVEDGIDIIKPNQGLTTWACPSKF